MMGGENFPTPENEKERLKLLNEYHVLDTPEEEDFDRLVQLAARLFNSSIVLISLIDKERQFFKARIGIDICETSRDVSFCTHAILQDDILYIPDALEDPRFSTNPLVLGAPFIRFYAGKPLSAPTGEKLGTLCVIDSKPRHDFSDEDRQNLSDLAAMVMDRLELRRLDHIKNVSQTRFKNIAATSPDGILCTNALGAITFWNPSAQRMFGYSDQEFGEKSSLALVPDRLRKMFSEELQRLQNGEQIAFSDQTIELEGRRKDGSEFPAEVSLSTWPEGKSRSVGAIVRDVTDRYNNEKRLYQLASLDPLTNLHNRSAWRSTLDKIVSDEQPATVLLLDLDGFKEVNDTFGHSAGDTLLKGVAERLKNTCSDAIKVARLGGDEFVALLSGNQPEVATTLAQQLINNISRPYDYSGQVIEIGVTVGIALFPTHSTKPEELLSSADMALYRAKEFGKGRYELFQPALRKVAVSRRNFEQELKQAFETGQFELFYQPQIDVQTQAVTGAEALLRWRHPRRGLLRPASFIDVLSKKPSAPAVGEWVLRTACSQAAQWRKINPDFRISVNLFESQIHSGRLFNDLKSILKDTGLPGEALELEVMENIMLRNDNASVKLLRNLRELGIGLAFDDYGTGFASLSFLKRYPVSRLKIDRSFVRDVTVDPEDAALVNAIIYLSKSFGLKVIAEGVETEEQLAFLRSSQCTEAQGYLFAEPMPAEAFLQWITTSR